MASPLLELTDDEREAADAAYGATVRTARLLPACASRGGDGAAADATSADTLVILAHGPHGKHGPRGAVPAAADPAALAALLVEARAVRDGMRIVLATGDGADFAARLTAAMAALGRAVACTSRASDFRFGLRVAPRRRVTDGRPAGAATGCEAQAPV